jgi:hypothetical protein
LDRALGIAQSEFGFGKQTREAGHMAVRADRIERRDRFGETIISTISA